MILEILTGDRSELRQQSRSIAGIDGAIQQLVADMLETMRACHMASLSAPQCGKPLRLFVTEIYGESKVWMNPEVLKTEGEQASVESCASFPDLTLEVPRPQTMVIHTMQLDGSPVVQTISGIEARLVAHELDHLDGILFQDHLDAESLFEQMLGTTDEYTIQGEDPIASDDGPFAADSSFESGQAEIESDEEELQHILDLLADSGWKLALAAELLRDYELDEEQEAQLQRLDGLENAISESVTYWENELSAGSS
ncbi:peptide deformylase [Alicyclobacillus mengziensis]|uniref:Peptide deformylase n=1 Tax=Alicyclobacillus mengziensis TaxID=2931921 RepID=A0A9X7VWZ8_9BACL|nr:peptide deformylase [Alicyclobacillus mengziensis]QSO46387.1 peptide deformylase [Alicyclobacillus mengziensis]